MRISSKLIQNSVHRLNKSSRNHPREFSSSISFLSPDYKPLATATSDFFSPTHYEMENRNTNSDVKTSSQYKPMATAFSDFFSPTMAEQIERNIDESENWSNELSFATPESDFTSRPNIEYEMEEDHVINHSSDLSYATPEADFTSSADMDLVNRMIDIHDKEFSFDHSLGIHDENEEFSLSSAYALSFATPESDWTSNISSRIMKEQLEHVEKTGPIYKTIPLYLRGPPKEHSSSTDLPKTFDQRKIDSSSGAIVVTEKAAPFRIVSVNAAWEQLCGFTHEESVGKTLSILQGPETDRAAITTMLSQMLKGEEVGMELMNYDKSGRKFKNRLKLGSLRSEETNEITHFVGLLKEVEDSHKKKVAIN